MFFVFFLVIIIFIIIFIIIILLLLIIIILIIIILFNLILIIKITNGWSLSTRSINHIDHQYYYDCQSFRAWTVSTLYPLNIYY